MADETNKQADATQVDANAAAQSQVDNDDAQGGADETLSAEAARKLRSESQSLRTRLKDAEKRVSEFEQQTLTETEKRDRELSDARTETARLKAEVRSVRVEKVAGKLGFIDPEDASALIGEVDDDADEKQIRKQLQELLSRKPHLAVGTNNVDANEGRQSGSRSQSMNDLIRTAAGRRS